AERAKALSFPPALKSSGRRGRAKSSGQPAKRQMILVSSLPSEPYLAPLLDLGSSRGLVQKGDTVLLTGAPMPGSGKMRYRVINNLYRQGVSKVVELLSVGAYSSHAAREELKLMLSLTRPQNLIPVHGEARHLRQHRQLAIELGWAAKSILLPQNGECVDFKEGSGALTEHINTGKLLVDGLGIGDNSGTVQRDRKQLAADGLLIAVLTISRTDGSLLGDPSFISRGFLYEGEESELLADARERLREVVAQQKQERKIDWNGMKAATREALAKLINERMRRRPVILTVIREVPAHTGGSKKGR
ncbi:MAG: ribonuclease J, partial [Symbiobacteriaceae bacterium]|nr:ribonuclease J [Symbiobacteriaceae bacterium]